MIPVMFKLTFASTVALICLAGCGGQSAESSPANDPSDADEVELDESEPTEPEATEPESDEPYPYEPDSTGPESTEPESDESESDESESTAATSEPEPEKTCAGLTQKTCEVTQGCAWSTTRDCIDQR